VVRSFLPHRRGQADFPTGRRKKKKTESFRVSEISWDKNGLSRRASAKFFIKSLENIESNIFFSNMRSSYKFYLGKEK
jgi:hypothetical protein